MDLTHIIPTVQHYILNIQCVKTNIKRVSLTVKAIVYDRLVEYINTLYKGNTPAPVLHFDGIRNVYVKSILPLENNKYETDVYIIIIFKYKYIYFCLDED